MPPDGIASLHEELYHLISEENPYIMGTMPKRDTSQTFHQSKT